MSTRYFLAEYSARDPFRVVLTQGCVGKIERLTSTKPDRPPRGRSILICATDGTHHWPVRCWNPWAGRWSEV